VVSASIIQTKELLYASVRTQKTMHLNHCRIIPHNQDSISQVLIRETNRIVGLPMSDLVFLLMILSSEQRGQQVMVVTIRMEVDRPEV
jgi:hypothetical protein